MKNDEYIVFKDPIHLNTYMQVEDHSNKKIRVVNFTSLYLDNDDEYYCRMRLDEKQVQELIEELQEWLELSK